MVHDEDGKPTECPELVVASDGEITISGAGIQLTPASSTGHSCRSDLGSVLVRCASSEAPRRP